MATLHLLGTGAALSDPHRTVTMLAVDNAHSVIVVDCGGDVIQRLMAAGVALDRIGALIVTHEHADHVGGFPLFMEKIWLAGRRIAIPVYGIAPALEQARRAFESFDTSGWEGMPPIEWHEVAAEEGATLIDHEGWRVTATPGTHSVPVIGLRIEDRIGGGVMVYSSDTGPCTAITTLARAADLLVHEATGVHYGHSNAVQAAQVAAAAGARQLLLVHLPPASLLTEELLDEARGSFAALEVGTEEGRYDF